MNKYVLKVRNKEIGTIFRGASTVPTVKFEESSQFSSIPYTAGNYMFKVNKRNT